jgi:putative membrane-bound dehydrogenase-like protein
MRRTILGLALGYALATSATPAAFAQAASNARYQVGTAKIDITPTYAIRLSGFGYRRSESEGITQRIYTRALALRAEGDEPAVLITVDNLGIPYSMTQTVAARLAQEAKLNADRLVITATHTHTAPMLKGVAPTLFGQPIPEEQQQRIERYTAELTDNLVKVAVGALVDLKPARLTWGVGKVTFAMNRRTKGGPVDHDLPLLVVRDPTGRIRALYVNYACHCVTLSNNQISGDWAGYAQQQMEDDHPGAVAMVSIGCGADSNPNTGVTGDKTDIARLQGTEIAREVRRLLDSFLAPVTGKLIAHSRSLDLPLAALPDRAAWEAKAQRKDAIGYHARVNLARLDRQEPLKTKIVYPIKTWTFGDSLAMVFLSGEVVVDYSLRLKKELDRGRLWINAYANDAPCYIPSERVLKEGGYEGGGAMVYYDLPGPLAPGLEDKIVTAVKALVGPGFRPAVDENKTGGTHALAPQQSRALIRTRPGLTVQLVAAEPLVTSPVAIDFGPDGKLYVAEMVDYPQGEKGKFEPGGRIRVLEDTDGDGIYDKSTVFLDNLPFPTGVTVWRKGILICAAPDILYAEDTNGDGKADVVKKLFSGFGTHNYQARVNSLTWALDGWVYGSCGLFGGKIECFTPDGKSHFVELGDRDFRIDPDRGLLEPATGRTQQGRARNDWDDWFGCDNSNLCRHYPLADHYLKRNPHVAAAATSYSVADYPDSHRLYPLSKELQLFKLSGPPGHTTAACGLGIYRDVLLDKEYQGNAFVCEPVNLCVHRLALSPKGSTFSGRRAPGEEKSEFLASTDTWFRPVQVRTGPDGSLWIVDMYRYVIEHPRWIPPEDLGRADLRAGSTMGRIYRVFPNNERPKGMPRLTGLKVEQLAATLSSPNGCVRDMASQALLVQPSPLTVAHLEFATNFAERPETRLHALSVLGTMGKLPADVVSLALRDPHPGVARHAVRLAEPLLASDPMLGPALLPLVKHADAQVRLQVAYTLGSWRDPRAAAALADLLAQHSNDPFLTAAVLSSVRADNLAGVITRLFEAHADTLPPPAELQRLFGMAAALEEPAILTTALRKATASASDKSYAPWQFAALAAILDAGRQRGTVLDKDVQPAIDATIAHARMLAGSATAPERDRVLAIVLLGRQPSEASAELALIAKLLAPQSPASVQRAAVAAATNFPGDSGARVLLDRWRQLSPALQAQTLDLVLGKAGWQSLLLDGIAKGTIPAGSIDAARRQRLLTSKSAPIRTRAAKLFAVTSGDRQKVLADHQDITKLNGDPVRGKAIFTKSCAVCHRFRNLGTEVGPDLTGHVAKTPEFLLTEILDPNRNVDSRYIGYLAVTRSGQSVTGVLAAETATSITLRAQDGKEHVVLRSDLDELTSTGRSLMPEGLERDLSRQDLADVIAFIRAAE